MFDIRQELKNILLEFDNGPRCKTKARKMIVDLIAQTNSCEEWEEIENFINQYIIEIKARCESNDEISEKLTLIEERVDHLLYG